MTQRLTKPLIEAISSALDAALAGDGFDGGDFDGQNREHFERARDWIAQQGRRERRSRPATTKPEDQSHG